MSGLGLSEGRAYNFILVARSAAKIVKLQDALRAGEITLSKAKRLAPIITEENADQWIESSKQLSQRMLERAVARVAPKTSVEEGSRFISENLLELKAVISLETEQLLKRVQDLLSQSKGNAASFDEALKNMAKLYLEKNDPVLKAERVLKKKIVRETQIDSQNDNSGTNLPGSQKDWSLRPVFERRPIPTDIHHEIYFRDQGECQQLGLDGKKCRDSRWIDVHHLVPVAEGGPDTVENLITLCKAHHQMEHN